VAILVFRRARKRGKIRKGRTRRGRAAKHGFDLVTQCVHARFIGAGQLRPEDG
jgi:hypothetical protein